MIVELRAELDRRDRVIKDIEGELRYKEENLNARIREITAELQNKVAGHTSELSLRDSDMRKGEK